MRCLYCGSIMSAHRVELVEGHTLSETSGNLGGNQDAWRAAMACSACRSTGPSATGGSPQEALARAVTRQETLMGRRDETKEAPEGDRHCYSIINSPVRRW
jgi:hypothetical protein